MNCQNLKVKLVRDVNFERHLLEKYPRPIVNRRFTVAQDLLAQPVQHRRTTGKKSSVPIGLRGRKRLSLDVAPKSNATIVPTNNVRVSTENEPNSTDAPIQAVNINLNDADPIELNVQVCFINPNFGILHYSADSSDSDISSESAVIDLDDIAGDPDEHRIQMNFLEPNFGTLSFVADVADSSL